MQTSPLWKKPKKTKVKKKQVYKKKRGPKKKPGRKPIPKKKPKPKPPKPVIRKDRICWCGKVFTVTAREALNLLDEFDLFCSEECLLNYINQAEKSVTNIPKNSPMVPYDYSNYDPITKNFYRSLFEVWLARCLKANNIKFKYEPHAFLLDGRYYTPDFYLPEKEIYIECKGLWKKLGKTKVRKLREHANLLLLPSYFQKLLKQYKRKDDMVK